MTPPRRGTDKLRLAVLVSGSGRTLDNLLERIATGGLAARVAVVVSSRDDVRGVRIAEEAAIPVSVVSPHGRSVADLSDAVFGICDSFQAEVVVMAGFLHLVRVPPLYVGRVINIHPSLLPAFGGRGFYGMRVHRAVLERGCTISGCTVHLVDDEYDHGRILLQKAVPVLVDDTPESLAARVFAAECAALPEAIAAIASGAIS